MDQELAEVKEEADLVPLNHSALEMEVGDLLFVAAAVGRRLNIDPERALHRANAKFVRRFNAVEAALAPGAKTASAARKVRSVRTFTQGYAPRRPTSMHLPTNDRCSRPGAQYRF